MKYFSLLTCILSFCVNAHAAEWCPEHNGAFPSAVVDVGEYKIYYFTEGSIYSEDEQPAVAHMMKGETTLSVSNVFGSSDYFTSTQYEGRFNGFTCDSATLNFEQAWLIDETGAYRNFQAGEVRAPGYINHELECTSETQTTGKF